MPHQVEKITAQSKWISIVVDDHISNLMHYEWVNLGWVLSQTGHMVQIKKKKLAKRGTDQIGQRGWKSPEL